MTIKNYIISWEGKKEVDITTAKKVYDDLLNDRTHPEPCCCPSCLYHEHKKQGGKYDKESFFLSWLEFEILFSMVNQEERIIFEAAHSPGIKKTFIKNQEIMNFIKGYGRIKVLSEFLENNFPDIDHNHERLKLKLWRFKKSEVESKASEEIGKRWAIITPKEKKDEWENNWKILRFAQDVSNYIHSLHKKRIDRRTLLREEFQGKQKQDLERIHGLLQLKGIFHKREGYRNKTVVYYYSKKELKKSLQISCWLSVFETLEKVKSFIEDNGPIPKKNIQKEFNLTTEYTDYIIKTLATLRETLNLKSKPKYLVDEYCEWKDPELYYYFEKKKN